MRKWRTFTAGLTSALVCACAADAVGPASPAASVTPLPGSAFKTQLTLDGAVQAARADAAQRSGLAPDAFELISAGSVTWADGSLGCAQPGVMYTQALVPGYRVRLRGPAGELDYHGSRRSLTLCPSGRAADPLPDGSTR
jgi:hypothetical protein